MSGCRFSLRKGSRSLASPHSFRSFVIFGVYNILGCVQNGSQPLYTHWIYQFQLRFTARPFVVVLFLVLLYSVHKVLFSSTFSVDQTEEEVKGVKNPQFHLTPLRQEGAFVQFFLSVLFVIVVVVFCASVSSVLHIYIYNK